MEMDSVISSAHPGYIESLYKDYKKNPQAVQFEWRKFFEGFDFAVQYATEGKTEKSFSDHEFKVWRLIDVYRRKAHLVAKTNPIRERKDRKANLDIAYFGLDESNLPETYEAGEAIGMKGASLGEIIARLQQTYCGSIGIQYKYMADVEQLKWLQDRFESEFPTLNHPIEKKKRILKKLNESEVFERFLSTKFIGQKRFSLEGGETTIPALDAIVNKAAEDGVEEIAIGMAHRGRLNVLVNLLGKTYEQVFSEFEGNATPDLTMGDGDVKYHLGYSSEIATAGGKKVHLKLAPNPSHLEAVNPVVTGFVRAKADILYNSDFKKIVPVLIHGDASLAGQGIAYEVIQMSQLHGYQTGGTIHFVINNQIGFTTDFDDARSSDYCTSLAATIHAPVIHVNGDDADAVIYACELATEFRQKFNKDVFIDMVCYRRHGHNEGDDPKFTQPNLYKLISKHPSPREVYSNKLVTEGNIEASLAKKMDQAFTQMLRDALDEVKQKPLPYHYQAPELAWKELRTSTPADFTTSPHTGISDRLFNKVAKGILHLPDEFKPLKKIETLLKKQHKMLFDEQSLDWAAGELMAYGSLLTEGVNIRLSGQDSKRGTFSHRHAVLYDEHTSAEFNRLNHLDEDQQARLRIYNSLLSEFAVLGFEFGYSWATPETLTIWEAQFGDFSNGAQTIIDQFISSGESKWQRMSGLVLLLPHGYEGQGPEHSSARIERFLQLSAEYNMVIANCTTPANFFHLIRRQMAWAFRKPLVVFTPKSLLRHPACRSPKSDFTSSGFKEILVDDFSNGQAEKVHKLVFCSGKIYYDLMSRQEKEQRNDMVIARLEQLYPLPYEQIDKLVAAYPNADKIWLQEEPANMGAWVYMLSCYRKVDWQLIARKSSASPATGYYKIHEEEQQYLLDKVFN